MIENSLAPPTRFDWHFRVGDIPVRVHPYFWLVTALLGLRDLDRPPVEIFTHLLAWVVIVFVSILVHEMGHVLMGRHYGRRGHIILTGFCGLAVGSSDLPHRWQRIAVSLAGPGAGFLLAGVVFTVYYIYYPGLAVYTLGSIFHLDMSLDLTGGAPPEIVRFIVLQALWINILWGLVNLLPIWPLDGGQVCREICEKYRRREGYRISLQISLFTAAGFAVLALVELVTKKPLIPFLPLGGSLFAVIFFGLLAFNSWQVLKFVRRGGGYEEEPEPRAPWERDADWWKSDDNSWRD